LGSSLSQNRKEQSLQTTILIAGFPVNASTVLINTLIEKNILIGRFDCIVELAYEYVPRTS
jgi:hypothetical protein